MTFTSTMKKVLKFSIVALLLVERYWHYNGLLADDRKDTLDLHQEILGKDFNFHKIQRKYDNHQLFSIPFAKSVFNKFQNFIEHKINLNQTVSHHGHSHIMDIFHTNNNKLNDLDSKFQFFFLTAYDLLMLTFLFLAFTKDSLVWLLPLLFDSGLKVFSSLFVQFTQGGYKIIYSSIYSFISHILSKDFKSLAGDLSNFMFKERTLVADIAVFALLFVLSMVILSEQVQSTLGLSEVAEVAHEATRVIKSRMKEMGVGAANVNEVMSPDIGRSKLEEKNYSPDNINLKTVETEGEEINNNAKNKSTIDLDNPTQSDPHTSFYKIVPPSTTIRQKSRDNTPSKRRQTPKY